MRPWPFEEELRQLPRWACTTDVRGCVACVVALLYAYFWVGSHPQFLLEDLLLVAVMALLGAFAVAPAVVVVVVVGMAVLIGGLFLVSVCLFLLLAAVWLVMSRASRILYECARAVCVTAINTLLYPQCRHCGHHHLHAIARRPSAAAGAGLGRPAAR